MTYAEHHRIEIYGTTQQGDTSAGSEIWSFSFASSDALQADTLAQQVGPAVRAWYTGASNKTRGDSALVGVRVEQILATGKVGNSYNYAVANPPYGGITPTLPSITMMAVTLETGQTDPKGRKIRGRVYPPLDGPGPFSGSSITTTNALPFATSVKALINALNTAGAVICVASQTAGGQNVSVTGVSVDTVIDTQRRRKNALTGTRQSITL